MLSLPNFSIKEKDETVNEIKYITSQRDTLLIVEILSIGPDGYVDYPFVFPDIRPKRLL